ncbi:hypothetical protein [Pelagibius marinus]|uniref:hypothetical protein n=1 Tax=Pelagibius marinus TaxID=2762760 RepID=UPI001872D684|nr:hypothetical protein [Pelagibius marinus]
MLRTPLHRVLLAALLALAVLTPAAPLQAQEKDGPGDGYVAGIPDLPLMPGLQTLPDSGVVFDKPGGRIVEAFAEGDVAAQAVHGFYDQTLPQLGWRREAAGAYLREGERLKLDLSEEAGRLTVHFRLFPQ